jgi:hypothetical protein
MTEATLQEVFGASATQDGTTITILKSDLDMTVAAVNRGEQVFAAIVKKGSAVFTQAAFDIDDTRSITIEPGYDSLKYRTINAATTTLLQKQVVIGFHQVQATSGINPDNY